MAEKRLTAAQARKLIEADRRCRRARRELEAAESERRTLIDALLPRFVIGEWVAIARHRLRITMQSSGERFSLAAYRKAGHEVSDTMRAFVSEAKDSPRLWVEEA